MIRIGGCEEGMVESLEWRLKPLLYSQSLPTQTVLMVAASGIKPRRRFLFV
jgi:hypothetical protein